MTSYPTSIPIFTEDPEDEPAHALSEFHHNHHNTGDGLPPNLIAGLTKLGTGDSIAELGTILVGSDEGATVWQDKWLVDVRDFGAVGDGLTDDLAAFQAAFDEDYPVVIPPGKNYILDGSLTVNNYQAVMGLTGHANSDTAANSGSAKLIFTGSGTACFSNADPSSSLIHGIFRDFTVRVTGTYDWIYDFRHLLGFKFWNLRSEASGSGVGGFRSQRLSSAATWVNDLINCEIRLPDSGTARTLDVDFSDCNITGGNYTGGRGAILRGTGGVKVLGVRFDRVLDASYAGVTISSETESKSVHQLVGCQIEENRVGLLIDGDANDSIAEGFVMPIITGCHFRQTTVGDIDVKFQNATGAVLKGGLVSGNSFDGPNSTPLSIDTTRWTGVTWGPNQYRHAVADLVFFSPDQETSITVIDRMGINLVDGIIHGGYSGTVNGQANVSGSFGITSTGPGVILGALSGATPFVGASRNAAGTSSDLVLSTDNTARLRLDKAGGWLRPEADNATDLGQSTKTFKDIWLSGQIRWGSNQPLDTFGSGSPEGVVAAPVGSTYRRSDGGTGTSFYVKETGTNTSSGWVAK